ncbi:MAG: hypothetical protein GF329_12700 [Candidatus Lokiarchaeota archaeon]|nr:hypothetical protein [Candidatus Lokiarchaeota archaeon]
MGLNLHQKSKDIKKVDKKLLKDKHEFIKYSNVGSLAGYSLIIFCFVYMVLFLLEIIPTVQFYPNVIFASGAFEFDLSIIFNILILYFMINVIYRIGSKILGRSLKLSTIAHKEENES